MKPPYPRSSDAAKPLRSRIDCTPYTYMWIPAEVRTSSRGTEAAFASYVNGLSPFTETSRRLYDPIAKAFAAMLPLFEASLAFSPLRGDPAFLQALRKGSRRKGHNLVRNQLGRPSSSRMAAPSPASTGSSRWRPTVGSFVPPPLRTVKLCGKTLQVVVRLTKADVAPKAPAKHSHKWHLQGLPDESICASGIHYLACSNVHPPRSLFRVAVDGECWDAAQYQHLQDHQKKDLFGFSSEDLHAGFAQDIGSVEPQPGGCFVYPGFMARKESPLKLIDPTKPGHLVTLEIYLVDPERPTLSSTRTVPQRVDWLRDATLEGTSEDPRCRLNRLPNEILHRIFAALEDDVGQGELRSTARSARPATFLASRAFALQRRSADIARRASEDCEIMAAFDEEYGRGYADEAYRDSQERLERRFAGLGVRLPPGGFTHANRSGNRARSRF
ncbi:uncharacterized protein PFL1_05569 [Pseudozyma flocculosa PF-1]|nr:uncharacterized protein PFL1_05569 [Pseudozyma flocculosa PF-1]EPQ26935.1 hypothetical protein PFL1_05569 [Pseudozyma flocculosa PF-1]